MRNRARTTGMLLVWTLIAGGCAGSGEPVPAACEGMDRAEGGTLALGGRDGAIVHVPESYDPRRATAVVLVFHGGGEDPDDMEARTRFSELAEDEGFLAVYPIGRVLNRSVDRGWSLTIATEPTEQDDLQQSMATWLTEGLETGNPDVRYVDALLTELEDLYCLDHDRIYAAGHSFGAGFSFVLACTRSDRIAAAGVASLWAVQGLGDCEPSRSVPIMGFYSIDDSGYDGGEWAPYVVLWPYVDFQNLWADLNGCSTGPEPGETSGGAISQVWSGCESSVVMWTLADGGHTWPGGDELFASTDIDATQALWEFFSEHPLP